MRRDRIRGIYDLRISQLEAKHFREQMRKLEQHDRDIRRQQARAEGRRLDLEPNEVEAEVLDRQQHHYLSDWSPDEQERFKREQTQIWSLIPEQFRQRAETLAKGGYG